MSALLPLAEISEARCCEWSARIGLNGAILDTFQTGG
jgi:hypothetical protein